MVSQLPSCQLEGRDASQHHIYAELGATAVAPNLGECKEEQMVVGRKLLFAGPCTLSIGP